MEKKETRGKGISFVGALTLIFIVLKLTGAISWSWIWVLCPLWISFILGLLVLLFILFVTIIVTAINDAIN